MGISLGLVGLGQFGKAFANLFKSHPAVDRIGLCDAEPERIRQFAEDPFFQDKFNSRDAYESLDDICRADFDALVIITQPWLHAPQCLQAMEAGKHVYSAVPVISIPDDDEILEWCQKLIDTSQRTGQHYMLGETTYYRAHAMFCRRKAAQGAFGDFVYAEGEYCHDLDNSSNLRRVNYRRYNSRTGEEGKQLHHQYVAQGHRYGPMHYPTHSISGPVCVMNTQPLKVTAYGFSNRNGDPFFKDFAFSNEIALFRMRNGSTVRIAETREAPGILGNSPETFRIMGTRGSYSENRWFETDRPDFQNIDIDNLPVNSRQELTDADMRDPLPAAVTDAFKQAMNKEVDPKDLHNLEFNPRGHGGSHPYLVHEFVDAIVNNRRPAINIWEASRYMAMGVAAHKSALRDGETLDVPDFGDPPED